MKNQLTITACLVILMFMGLNAPAQKYSRLSDFPEYMRKSKPFKRFEWFYQQRAYPNDTIPYIYASRVRAEEIKKIRQKSNQGMTFANWVSKGPSFADYTNILPHWDTVSGRVRALAVHPTDHQTVYIGAASGGLWKTTDGGETWLDIGHDIESLAFGAIAIDPNNPEIVYAGSGESVQGTNWHIFGGYGLYKSMDEGETWDTINAFGDHTFFTDIAVSSFDSAILFASLASGSLNLGNFLPNEGVWKSTDAGNSWVKTLDLPFAFDITLHPADPDIVYACIGGLLTGSGIYVSTDQGVTWNESNTGLPAQESIDRLHMDISQSDPDILYAVISLWINNEGVTQAYKSLNGGSSWTHISAGTPLGGYWYGWYDQGWYDLCIAVDPVDSDHVFIGNVELHETTDGQNFSPVRYPGGTNITESIAHCDYHQLKYAPSNPDFFYIGCDGGVYLSTDGCNTSKSRNVGLETIQFYRMASHPTDPNIMIAGSQDNGTIRTMDGGNSWEVVLRWDGMECFFDRNNPDLVYASQQFGNLHRSLDGGASFSFFKNINGAFVTPFFAHPYGPDTLYAANDDIYKLSNGMFFQAITNGLSPVLIKTMAQSRANPLHMILTGTNVEIWPLPPLEQNVMISADGGYNWTDVTTNIPGDRWISSVVTHPYDENTMFVVRCGYSEGNKIYRTTDLGQNWENISGNLPNIPCNVMFINPGNSDHYYMGTDLGVYLSEDAGITWNFAGDGMPLVPVLDFDFVDIGGTPYLRAATHGRGIYETSDLAVGMYEGESKMSEVRILVYPNPVDDFLKISINLGLKIDKIIIYNLMGQEVLIGKPEDQILDVSSLPSGLYVVEVVYGNRKWQGKFIK